MIAPDRTNLEETLLPYRPRPDERILLFDGECALCNGWVDFVIARDPAARVKVASIQSEIGKRVLAGVGLDPHGFTPSGSESPTPHSFEEAEDNGRFDSMVFVENQRAHLRSNAALQLVKNLRSPWSLFAIGLWIPRPLRDWFYDRIAEQRYEWFGRREVCRVPTADLSAHFLEEN